MLHYRPADRFWPYYGETGSFALNWGLQRNALIQVAAAGRLGSKQQTIRSLAAFGRLHACSKFIWGKRTGNLSAFQFTEWTAAAISSPAKSPVRIPASTSL